MPRVFRLVQEKHTRDPSDLVSGEGARIYGGRWNRKGIPLIYTASHVSLAVLESLVHCDVLPKNMVLVAYDVPELSTRRAQSTESLPADWAEYPIPASTQDFGAAWAASRSELVMTVPSAVVPVETNWLINPAHADIATVTATLLGRYPFDSRLSG